MCASRLAMYIFRRWGAPSVDLRNGNFVSIKLNSGRVRRHDAPKRNSEGKGRPIAKKRVNNNPETRLREIDRWGVRIRTAHRAKRSTFQVHDSKSCVVSLRPFLRAGGRRGGVFGWFCVLRTGVGSRIVERRNKIRMWMRPRRRGGGRLGL